MDLECNRQQNLSSCNCTYEPCPRKGACCACLRFHLAMRELPACAFDARAERTYDRSFAHFAALLDGAR